MSHLDSANDRDFTANGEETFRDPRLQMCSRPTGLGSLCVHVPGSEVPGGAGAITIGPAAPV
jgi:hypothetical protein